MFDKKCPVFKQRIHRQRIHRRAAGFLCTERDDNSLTPKRVTEIRI